MTTQEFVKKECEQYAEKVSFQVPYNGTNDFYNEERLKTSKLDFSDGLTKGLEIAELFQQFVEHDYFKVMDKYMLKYGRLEDVESHKTRGELLTIFLTEKYGK